MHASLHEVYIFIRYIHIVQLFHLASSVVRKPENCIHYIHIDFLDSTGHLKWGLLQSRVMMLLSPILIEPKLLCVAKAALTLAKVSKGWFHRHRCQRCPMSELGRNWVGTGSVETGSELGRNWVGTGSELGLCFQHCNVLLGSSLLQLYDIGWCGCLHTHAFFD